MTKINSTNFKKAQKFIKLLIWLILLSWLTFHLDHFLKIDSCLDSGNVWDYNENRCRSDCLAIIKSKGCIYMDKKFRQMFSACADRLPSCDRQKFETMRRILCKQYQGAWEIDGKYCDFEFTVDKCGKLKGNWQYPEICPQ